MRVSSALPDGRIARNEPHAWAIAFAVACCLTGVPQSGVLAGTVPAQTDLLRSRASIPLPTSSSPHFGRGFLQGPFTHCTSPLSSPLIIRLYCRFATREGWAVLGKEKERSAIRCRLYAVQLRILALLGHQFIVRPDLHEPRAIQHKDEIRHPHRRETV